MNWHKELLKIINETTVEALKNSAVFGNLLDKIDINSQDRFKLTVVERLAMEGEGLNATRIAKAWVLHDYYGASLKSIVFAYAAIGKVKSAYELCSDYQVSPRYVAFGLARSGNFKALDGYFKKYEVDHRSESDKEEEQKCLFNAFSTIVQTGNSTLLDDYFRRYNPLYQGMTARQQRVGIELTGMSIYGVCVAASIYGGQAEYPNKKDLCLNTIKNIKLLHPKKSSKEQFCLHVREVTQLRCILLEALAAHATNKRHIVSIIHKIQNARGGSDDMRSVYRGFVRNKYLKPSLLDYFKAQSEQVLGFYLTQEEIARYKIKGYARFGDVDGIASELKHIPKNVEKMREILKDCAESCQKNGYLEAALQIKNRLYPKFTAGNYVETQPESKQTFFTVSRYLALHDLCFMSDADREAVVTVDDKPGPEEEKRSEYVKQANKIHQIRSKYQIGFSAAKAYYDNYLYINSAMLAIHKQSSTLSRFSPEIKQMFLSFGVSTRYLHQSTIYELYCNVFSWDVHQKETDVDPADNQALENVSAAVKGETKSSQAIPALGKECTVEAIVGSKQAR